MEDTNYSLLANYIAIGVLVLKSVFDLWINRCIFNWKISKGTDRLAALEERYARANWTSTVAFAAMSLSIILSIGGTMEDESNRPSSQDIASLQQALIEHSSRLKKIEDVIWPPTEGGDYGSPVPTGPWDPVGMENSLAEIKEKLADLTAKGNVTEDRLERLITIVNQLTENVEAYSKSVKQLEKFMAAPAG